MRVISGNKDWKGRDRRELREEGSTKDKNEVEDLKAICKRGGSEKKEG